MRLCVKKSAAKKFTSSSTLSSIIYKFQELTSNPVILNTINISVAVSERFSPFIEKPSFWNLCKASLNLSKDILSEYSFSPDCYFDDNHQWEIIYGDEFTQLITDAFRHNEFTVISSKELSSVKIVDMGDGCKLGFVLYKKLGDYVPTGNVYVLRERLEESKNKIKKALWEFFKEQSVLMRRHKIYAQGRESESIKFEPDVLFSPLGSKIADDYSRYIKKCIDANVHRSVMLYGPPGTGKSTMACRIVNNLSLRSFRIRVGDIEYIDNATLFDAVDIFKPDAIILDDFDRAGRQDDMLEVLEFFQQRVKLVIATVNNVKDLEQATIRPGRFDELVKVKNLDVNVIKFVLGPDNQDIFDEVKEWPIAFINELVKRRQFMSKDEALVATKELKKRVASLKEYDDEYDEKFNVDENEDSLQTVDC